MTMSRLIYQLLNYFDRKFLPESWMAGSYNFEKWWV